MPVESLTSGLLFDERFLAHDAGVETSVQTREGSFQIDPEPHPSDVAIIKRTWQFLERSGLLGRMRHLRARPAREEELLLYHTRPYLDGLQAHAAGGPRQGDWGEIDEDTPVSAASLEAALCAAGGACQAVEAVMSGAVRNVYALLRPPGHHAERNRALGYCIFNNVVIAAEYARRTYGLERIMIIDWDVHHGNGTQEAFYADPGVLFLSLHQRDWYPRLSGELEQVGRGAGVGYTVNIPLPAGTGDRGYIAAFEQLVLPIGLRYRPQLILISAGQDASWLDPLARMMVTRQGFRRLSELVAALADEVCEGRLVALQEGGYSRAYVPYCTAAIVEALLGVDLGIVDLYAGAWELERSATIFTQATRQALEEARRWHRQWWPL
ncbi:MAG: class II histone deacetylase [Thermogemmatispora sp.]|uniref:class II histone deacetylase n=1 Tax=Thermogemmatispora sp. TaxID=1968838 RepID=UPI00260D6F1E|nr:class II histone deacetylase [Thermogemmatispora sp.]MBX5458084.1 class II histone deacetylase [Thermogemmatispora sp.]